MCAYCMIGDWQFRHDPPWQIPKDSDPFKYVPQPVTPAPIQPWGIERLAEFYELLKRVKELEDKLGCPCEPNKADYLGLIRQRIEELEKRAGK